MINQIDKTRARVIMVMLSTILGVSRLKSVLCERFGPPSCLRIVDTQSPVPAADQVIVTVLVAPVNFPDTLIVQGKHQYRPALPFTPGLELVGEIKEIGANVTTFTPGDKVLAFTEKGGFAQEACVDIDRLVRLPDDLSAEQIETMGAIVVSYGTSLHALKDRARVRSGETLLVLGAGGGVGLAAVELGGLLGLRVIAAASSAARLAIARERGAHDTIDYSSENLRERVDRLTGGRGVDVVYDPVGGNYTDIAFRSLAWGGRHLMVGFTTGEIPKLALNLVLLKGASVIGVFFGEFVQRNRSNYLENMGQLLHWLQRGQIHPHISARYPLSRTAEAFDEILARKVIGKIIVTPQRLV